MYLRSGLSAAAKSGFANCELLAARGGTTISPNLLVLAVASLGRHAARSLVCRFLPLFDDLASSPLRARGDNISKSTHCGPRFILGVARAVTLGLVALAYSACASRTPPEARRSSQALLRVSPDPLVFPVVTRGKRRELRFWLINDGRSPVRISAINSSCDCFQVVPDRATVHAGEQVLATAAIDLRGDPTFAGCLDLEARGVDEDTRVIAFTLHAEVTVK